MAKYKVAVIGAGPAGLFASRELANNDIEVFLFNRDIKTGGLAEYGIYPDKHKLKNGLRKQFLSILEHKRIHYFGNIEIGKSSDLSINDLREMGFGAILVTAGAQETKKLNLPGADLKGVYHAWEIVSNYNLLPPFSERQYPIGKRVAIIGVGNVMADVARYLITKLQVDKITAYARRGPAEIKFYQTEFAEIAENLDKKDFNQELDRVSPLMYSLGQDPEKARAFIEKACENCKDLNSNTIFRLRFLKSPVRFLGDAQDQLTQLELIENTLKSENGSTKAVKMSEISIEGVDTVILAVGSSVDPKLGLPMKKFEFFTSPIPNYPINGQSFEILDPGEDKNLDGIFVAGWSRLASYGLVGISGRDGVFGAKAVMEYLKKTEPARIDNRKIINSIKNLEKVIVELDDVFKLMKVEAERAQKLGLEEYKFSTNQEMLWAIGLA